MLFHHHSLDGYSKLPTPSSKNTQIDFNKLENLNYQITPPEKDLYFDPILYKINYRKFRIDSRKSREESQKMISQWSFSFWDFFKLKFFPTIYSQYWYQRKTIYIANNEEFFAYQFHPEDVNFDTDFYKENRIKLTIVFNGEKYITINAFDFLAIGDVFNICLKYPIWTKFYSFTVQDNLHEFDLIDFGLQINYFVQNNILHDGSIILIDKLPTKRFLFL